MMFFGVLKRKVDDDDDDLVEEAQRTDDLIDTAELELKMSTDELEQLLEEIRDHEAEQKPSLRAVAGLKSRSGW